jgi:hypothetical protein
MFLIIWHTGTYPDIKLGKGAIGSCLQDAKIKTAIIIKNENKVRM